MSRRDRVSSVCERNAAASATSIGSCRSQHRFSFYCRSDAAQETTLVVDWCCRSSRRCRSCSEGREGAKKQRDDLVSFIRDRIFVLLLFFISSSASSGCIERNFDVAATGSRRCHFASHASHRCCYCRREYQQRIAFNFGSAAFSVQSCEEEKQEHGQGQRKRSR
jgi:hypothetical protein